MTKKQSHPPTITASEVAEFMFCAKAWQLKREGAEPDSPHLAPGVAFHRRHAQQLSFASQLHWAGWILFGSALVLLLFWVLR